MTANNALLEDIAKHIAGSSTPTLKPGYCGLSTSYNVPDKTSILESELARVVPSSWTRTGSIISINSLIGAATGNCLETTINTVTSATVFTVNSTTGLTAGDRVQITIASLANRKEERKISSIVGSTITLTEALSAAPATGDLFKQMISRVQLAHGSATATLNSGSAFSIAPYKAIKTSSNTIYFEHIVNII